MGANAVDIVDTRARKLVAGIASASGPKRAVLSRRLIYQVCQSHNAINSAQKKEKNSRTTLLIDDSAKI